MPEYRTVRIADLPDAPNPTAHKKEVDEAVGATTFGFNVYTVRPGERIPWGYHYHPDHEELFYVLDGTLVFDTPDGEFRVETDEAFFVPAGAPNLGRCVGDRSARVIAVGAPRDSDGAVISETCPACGRDTDRDSVRETVDGSEVYVLTCAECGAETDRFGPGPARPDE